MLDAAADLLVSRSWVALTGAGISTASGIPDYRGPDGNRRVTPMTIDEFRGSPEARRRYWARSYVGWQNLRRARPNPAHEAVTVLQRAGRVGEVITQNVDGLHQAAGTRGVLELHGSLDRVVCEVCRDVTSRRDLDVRMETENPGHRRPGARIRPDGDAELAAVDVAAFTAPCCLRCGSDRLRPDVVFFGDQVPRARVERARDLVQGAGGLLVLGSSLQVLSGLRWMRQAHRQGLPVLVVTRRPVRDHHLVTLHWDAPLEAALPALAARAVTASGDSATSPPVTGQSSVGAVAPSTSSASTIR